jgi:hypothetical protein
MPNRLPNPAVIIYAGLSSELLVLFPTPSSTASALLFLPLLVLCHESKTVLAFFFPLESSPTSPSMPTLIGSATSSSPLGVSFAPPRFLERFVLVEGGVFSAAPLVKLAFSGVATSCISTSISVSASSASACSRSRCCSSLGNSSLGLIALRVKGLCAAAPA